ncbi:hypothetical protein SOPP22_03135 [Shewanella sp. OPT22]|nr:hypothetical protein SOPP22_03135 [Shewanella sp. OPT22]
MSFLGVKAQPRVDEFKPIGYSCSLTPEQKNECIIYDEVIPALEPYLVNPLFGKRQFEQSLIKLLSAKNHEEIRTTETTLQKGFNKQFRVQVKALPPTPNSSESNTTLLTLNFLTHNKQYSWDLFVRHTKQNNLSPKLQETAL